MQRQRPPEHAEFESKNATSAQLSSSDHHGGPGGFDITKGVKKGGNPGAAKEKELSDSAATANRGSQRKGQGERLRLAAGWEIRCNSRGPRRKDKGELIK